MSDRQQKVVGTALSTRDDAPLRLIRQDAAKTVLRVQGFPTGRFTLMVLWIVSSLGALAGMLTLLAMWPLLLSAAFGIVVLLVGLLLPVADTEITLGATALSFARFRETRIRWSDIDEVRVSEIGMSTWGGLGRQDLLIHTRNGRTVHVPVWVRDPARSEAQVNASEWHRSRALTQGHLEWLADQMNARVMAMKQGAVPEAMDALRSAERSAQTARRRRRERE